MHSRRCLHWHRGKYDRLPFLDGVADVEGAAVRVFVVTGTRTDGKFLALEGYDVLDYLGMVMRDDDPVAGESWRVEVVEMSLDTFDADYRPADKVALP